jgi:putative Mg2+ transporter-C (MgtC) family protein
MHPIELAVRIGIAALAGAALGAERQVGGHHAGLRTHSLVAVGACVFTVAGAYGFTDMAKAPNVDPARVAAQVVSGIGFLGAGVILRDGGSIRGVTTAATIWIAAALGLASGSGSFVAVAIGTALAVAILAMTRASRKLRHQVGSRSFLLSMEYECGHGTLGPVLDQLERIDATLKSIRIYDHDEHLDEERPAPLVTIRRVEMSIRAMRQAPLDEAIHHMRSRPEVKLVNLTPIARLL